MENFNEFVDHVEQTLSILHKEFEDATSVINSALSTASSTKSVVGAKDAFDEAFYSVNRCALGLTAKLETYKTEKNDTDSIQTRIDSACGAWQRRKMQIDSEYGKFMDETIKSSPVVSPRSSRVTKSGSPKSKSSTRRTHSDLELKKIQLEEMIQKAKLEKEIQRAKLEEDIRIQRAKREEEIQRATLEIEINKAKADLKRAEVLAGSRSSRSPNIKNRGLMVTHLI